MTDSSKPRRVYADGAAIICGFAIFIPIPLLRGAIFCLFPGIAFRSSKTALVGAAHGALMEFLVLFLAMFMGAWEPRESYNKFLAHNLPPQFIVMTHGNSALSNGIRFGLGLILWHVAMYWVWMSLWKPTIYFDRMIRILAIGAIATGIAATILWQVAPLDEYWAHNPHATSFTLKAIPFFFVLITVLPLCSLLVGLLINRTGKTTRMPEELREQAIETLQEYESAKFEDI